MKKALGLLLTVALTACTGTPVTSSTRVTAPPDPPAVVTPQLAVPILDTSGNPTELTADLYADHSVIHLGGTFTPTCYEWQAEQFQDQDNTWHDLSGSWIKNNIYGSMGNHRRIPAGLNQDVKFRGVAPDRAERPCRP